MDKPVSLSVKAWIIRQMSVRSLTQERIIETVINHQFDSAYIALDNCNSLEFSGFGKFFFNRPKARKKLDKFKSQMAEFQRILDDPSSTDVRKRNISLKMETTKRNFNYLNKKLNGCNEDLRGLEEQVVSPEGIEREDQEGCGNEDGDMQSL